MNREDAGLLFAVQSGDHRGVQKWIERGGSIHAATRSGKTALMKCSNIDMLAWLIGEGLDVNARDDSGYSALCYAVEQHGPEAVRLLLNAGAEITANNESDRLPLHSAATWHKPQALRLLIDAGADVNGRREWGLGTPLMSAAWPWPDDTEAVETLDLLLSHGADVNATDCNGKTALIHLLEDEQHDEGHAELVSLLLTYNADIDIADSEGNTALYYSIRRGFKEVVSLLEQQTHKR